MGKAGVKSPWFVAALLALSACAAPPAAPLPPLPPVPPTQAPAPAVATPAPPPPGARTATDQCGASDLRYLVGRPKSEIPVPVDPGIRRVLCAGCPMTEDYSPMRQTILYAADTGLVTSVACG